MTSEFLSPEEIAQITEYALPARQRKQLTGMGLKYVATRSGKPLVSREAVRQLLGCKGGKGHTQRSAEPNLED